MKIISDVAHEDGSSWAAVIEVQGILFRASFVASKMSVGLVPYKHRPRRPRWAQSAVESWAKKRIDALPASWMEAHQAMYGR